MNKISVNTKNKKYSTFVGENQIEMLFMLKQKIRLVVKIKL